MWFSYWSAVSYIYIVAPCIALSVALHTVCHLHVLKCIWITVYNLRGQATLRNTQNDSSMQWYPALYPKALPSAHIGLRYTLRLHAGTYLLFHRGGGGGGGNVISWSREHGIVYYLCLYHNRLVRMHKPMHACPTHPRKTNWSCDSTRY